MVIICTHIIEANLSHSVSHSAYNFIYFYMPSVAEVPTPSTQYNVHIHQSTQVHATYTYSYVLYTCRTKLAYLLYICTT